MNGMVVDFGYDSNSEIKELHLADVVMEVILGDWNVQLLFYAVLYRFAHSIQNRP